MLHGNPGASAGLCSDCSAAAHCSTGRELPEVSDKLMCDQQCCGSGMFIPDPNFFFPDSGSSLQSGLPWYVFSLSRSGFPKRCGSNRIRIQKHWMLLQSTYLPIPESWLSAPFIHKINVADPGCLSRILDPNVYIPDPYKRKYCNLKMVSWLFILDLDPDFLPIPDPGVKKSPDPKSRIRIRSIAQNLSIRNTIFNSVADPWWLSRILILSIPDPDPKTVTKERGEK